MEKFIVFLSLIHTVSDDLTWMSNQGSTEHGCELEPFTSYLDTLPIKLRNTKFCNPYIGMNLYTCTIFVVAFSAVRKVVEFSGWKVVNFSGLIASAIVRIKLI